MEAQTTVPIDKTLQRLQKVMRAPSAGGDTRFVSSFSVPDDLATPEVRSLYLTEGEARLYEQAQREMQDDLRFEYLTPQNARAELWRFFCAAFIDRATNHVPPLISRLARVPSECRCFFPLLYLKIQEPWEIADALLLPLGDSRIPESEDLNTDPTCDGFISVRALGTNRRLMAERARQRAQHALRVIRVAMRGHPGWDDRQLRFHVGEAYIFDDGAEGWSLREDAASEAGLDSLTRGIISGQAMASLPLRPRTDIERRAVLALRWADRARMATEPLIETLYLFFALEALLGDKREGLKSYGLVFRRTVLSSVMTGSFLDPFNLFALYDQVRSPAVHGSEPPEITSKMLSSLDWTVRQALNECLAFAREHGLSKRSQVIAALINHEQAAPVIEWLRERSPDWEDYDPWDSHAAEEGQTRRVAQ